MKKSYLLSRAEMRTVIGGDLPIIGCEVTCYAGGHLNDPSTDPHPIYVTLLTPDCTTEAQQMACTLSQPVPGTCRNCTYDPS